MQCIEIVSTPAGFAPEEIRRAWVGLRLPLDPTFYGTRGRSLGSDGFVVRIPDAVGILELYNKEAAAWWRKNIDVDTPRGPFVFATFCCRPFNGLPSIVGPTKKEGLLLRDFLKSLDDEKLQSVHGLFGLREGDKKELEELVLNRPVVLLLSGIVAEQYARFIQGANSEEEYQEYLDEGHRSLQRIHDAAVKAGVEVPVQQIDCPLSLVDLAVQQGVLEQSPDGGLQLTEKGQEKRRDLDGDDIPF